MKEKVLLINLKKNLPKKQYINSIFGYYQIGPGEINNSALRCFNNQLRLNKIAIEEREEYSDWIANLNKNFLKNKLIYRSKISLFYFSDLSNKRNDIFNTYNIICNTILIKEIIKTNNFNKIIINGHNIFLNESLKSISNIKIVLINNINIKKSLDQTKEKITSSLLCHLLRHLRLVSKYFLFRIKLFNLIEKSFKKKIIANNIFFTRLPKHFKEDFENEDKYRNLFGKNDLFITNLLCDDLYQHLSLSESIKIRKKLKEISNKHIILDDFINFKNLLKSLYESKIYYFKFLNLLKDKYFYKQINITNLIKKEITFSYQRILGTLILYRGLKNIIFYIEANKYIYHLHEYVLGRMITFTLHDSNKYNTIGFQHGPSSFKLLLYKNSVNELPNKNNNFLNSVPIPNSVLAENKQSAEVYLNSGFRNVKVLEQVPRLSYLYDIKLNKHRNISLIVSGLHDFELVYNSTLKIIKDNPRNKFIFKPHPKSKINFEVYPLPKNAKYSKLHIKTLLVKAKSVYGSYSSVLSEAMYLKIKVNIIDCPGTVDLSSISEINL